MNEPYRLFFIADGVEYPYEKEGDYAMNISVKALNKRLPEVMGALDKKEVVVLSHEGKDIALLQAVPDIDDEIQRITNHPTVGMWADREDMKDPAEWVRKRRRGRRERCLDPVGGEKE